MDYKTLDDQSLMDMINNKDELAIGELYDRYSRLVYSMALNSVGEPAMAEEITQDVYLRVWKNAGSYRSERGKVATWMVSITRNRAIDEIRRGRVRPESHQVPWEYDEYDHWDRSINIEESIETTERRQLVRTVIAQLPEEQRQALALAYFQGYTHSEIAEILGEPLGTVKTRIRLAMMKLKQQLEPDS